MIENMSEVIQTGVDAATEAVHAKHPRSEFTVLVVAIPIARALLADADEGARDALRHTAAASIEDALAQIEWPFEIADVTGRP